MPRVGPAIENSCIGMSNMGWGLYKRPLLPPHPKEKREWKERRPRNMSIFCTRPWHVCDDRNATMGAIGVWNWHVYDCLADKSMLRPSFRMNSRVFCATLKMFHKGIPHPMFIWYNVFIIWCKQSPESNHTTMRRQWLPQQFHFQRELLSAYLLHRKTKWWLAEAEQRQEKQTGMTTKSWSQRYQSLSRM